MVDDARAVHRLRDERALYCDVWAMGLQRRAVLAAGARLCDRGLLTTPADALEAGPAELSSMLLRRSPHAGVAAAMRARGEARRGSDATAVPAELGDAPWAPIPVHWLPAGAARTERAVRTFLAAMEADDPGPNGAAELRGLPASPGVHIGRARIVRRADDLARVQAGDVLVSPAANSSLVVAFPRAGAMVTDHGGMLSHAAIVARERGIPAVVGTGDATSRIVDGVQLRVDGRAGVVVIAER
jgi:pyruvate,water dikinase